MVVYRRWWHWLVVKMSKGSNKLEDVRHMQLGAGEKPSLKRTSLSHRLHYSVRNLSWLCAALAAMHIEPKQHSETRMSCRRCALFNMMSRAAI